jgi:hypothetical protein
MTTQIDWQTEAATGAKWVHRLLGIWREECSMSEYPGHPGVFVLFGNQTGRYEGRWIKCQVGIVRGLLAADGFVELGFGADWDDRDDNAWVLIVRLNDHHDFDGSPRADNLITKAYEQLPKLLKKAQRLYRKTRKSEMERQGTAEARGETTVVD